MWRPTTGDCPMPTFTCDHIHLRSPDPVAAAGFYTSVLGATELERVQNGPALRVILSLAGLRLFIEQVPPGTAAPPRPAVPGRRAYWPRRGRSGRSRQRVGQQRRRVHHEAHRHARRPEDRLHPGTRWRPYRTAAARLSLEEVARGTMALAYVPPRMLGPAAIEGSRATRVERAARDAAQRARQFATQGRTRLALAGSGPGGGP